MRCPIVQLVAPLALASIALTSTALAGVVSPYVNDTGLSTEANYVNLQFPSSFTVSTGSASPTIYGRIYQGGMTDISGAANPSIVAQIGYGPAGQDPRFNDVNWSWFPTVFNVNVGNDDEYMGSFTAPLAAGTYWYTFRFSIVGGGSWTLADLDGAGSNANLFYNATYGATPNLGVMTVVPTPGAAALFGLGALATRRRRR